VDDTLAEEGEEGDAEDYSSDGELYTPDEDSLSDNSNEDDFEEGIEEEMVIEKQISDKRKAEAWR
jgi:hypothetical protein